MITLIWKTWVRIFRMGIFWMGIIWGDGSYPGGSFPDTRFVLFIKVLLSLIFYPENSFQVIFGRSVSYSLLYSVSSFYIFVSKI